MREGLCLLINSQTDLEVVAEAADGREAVRLANELAPGDPHSGGRWDLYRSGGRKQTVAQHAHAGKTGSPRLVLICQNAKKKYCD